MIKRILGVYGKWKMRRAMTKFQKAWAAAEGYLKRAGWKRKRRRQLKHDILKGGSVDFKELEG